MDSNVNFILLMDGFRPGQMDRFSIRDLIELCQIEPGQIILDIGCGNGATPTYQAKENACWVICIDLRLAMSALVQASPLRAGVQDRTDFLVADARRQLFEDAGFNWKGIEFSQGKSQDEQTIANELRYKKRSADNFPSPCLHFCLFLPGIELEWKFKIGTDVRHCAGRAFDD
jgi:SAM-dependent methyltransferase